ncbi:Poly(ADP-ribose) polymerase catalytic domain protein [compost metagenome]
MTASFILFHGTTRSNAIAIQETGFSYLKARSLAYGDGVYFYRDLEKALEYSRQKSEADACVLEVKFTCPQERVWKISGYEMHNFFPHQYNDKSVEKQSLILDISVDDRICVVRPEGLPLIRMCHRHI